MAIFQVHCRTVVTQWEYADIEVEASSPAEAKKLAQERVMRGEVDWKVDESDSDPTTFTVRS